MIRAIRQWHRGFSEINNDSSAMVIAGLPMMFTILGIFIGAHALSDPANNGLLQFPHLPNVTVDALAMLGCFAMAGALFNAFKKHGLWQSVKDNLNANINKEEATNGRLH